MTHSKDSYLGKGGLALISMSTIPQFYAPRVPRGLTSTWARTNSKFASSYTHRERVE